MAREAKQRGDGTGNSIARPSVGVPVAELELTRAFLASCKRVARPGRGRCIYVIEEPLLGAGRPDLVLITVSPAVIHGMLNAGLRLRSHAAARAINDRLGAGVSTSYARELARRGAEQGWTPRIAAHLAERVYDSVALEAKVKDWRRAIHQVSIFRPYFHQAAILTPSRQLASRWLNSLEFYGSGLVQLDGNHANWVRAPHRNEPTIASRIWLLELLIRGLEDGSAYRLSDSPNASIARK